MSNKTSKNLQLAAVILFGLALLCAACSIFMQEQLKGLCHADPAVLAVKSIPWSALISCAFHLILSVVCLVVIAKNPSRGKAIALVIVSAVLLALSTAIFQPALSMAFVALESRSGIEQVASYTALMSAVSMVTGVLTAPANVLMLLSLGGCIPKKQ